MKEKGGSSKYIKFSSSTSMHFHIYFFLLKMYQNPNVHNTYLNSGPLAMWPKRLQQFSNFASITRSATIAFSVAVIAGCNLSVNIFCCTNFSSTFLACRFNSSKTCSSFCCFFVSTLVRHVKLCNLVKPFKYCSLIKKKNKNTFEIKKYRWLILPLTEQ